MTFGEFISGVFGARMSFADIGAAIFDFFADFATKPGAEPVVSFFENGLADGEIVLPALLFLISLFLTVFGKRMLSLFRFAAFFALGYILGVYFLAQPISAALPAISPIVIGVAAAVVVSVLSKPLYFAAYAIAVATSVYVLVGSLLAAGIVTAIVAAAAVTVLAFIFRKYFEMLYTSLLGAFCVCKSLCLFWDFAAAADPAWVPVLIFTLVLGILGAFVQFKTRRRK